MFRLQPLLSSKNEDSEELTGEDPDRWKNNYLLDEKALKNYPLGNNPLNDGWRITPK